MKSLAFILFAILACSTVACSGGGPNGSVPQLSPPQSAQSATQSRVIAFLGDSITAGSQLPDNPKGAMDGRLQSPTAYPALVGDALNVPIANLAIGGETVAEAVTDQVPSIPLNARTVVIYLGTNDVTFGNPQKPIVQVAKSQYTIMLASVNKRVPRACIVLLDLPHTVYSPGMATYQDAFDSYLENTQYPTLDLRREAWESDPANFIADGVHPNVQGNGYLAISVERFLQTLPACL